MSACGSAAATLALQNLGLTRPSSHCTTNAKQGKESRHVQHFGRSEGGMHGGSRRQPRGVNILNPHGVRQGLQHHAGGKGPHPPFLLSLGAENPFIASTATSTPYPVLMYGLELIGHEPVVHPTK